MLRRIVLLMGLLCVLPTFAVVLRNGGTVTVGGDEVINDDLVISGGTIRVLGRVTGDLVVAGGNIEVSGPVGGSLTVACGNATVRGPVSGSIYVAAGTVDLNSTVRRNVVVAGGTVNANAESRVGRDLAVSAGTATLAGTVTRNVQASAGTLTLTNSARVGGDLIAFASTSTIATGAVIQGERRVSKPEKQRDGRGAGIAGWIIWQLLTGLALLLTGLVFVAAAPRLTGDTIAMLRTHPWGSLLAGLIVLLLTPLVFVLLLVTVLGIPLAFILLALYVIAVYISPIFVAIIVGLWILRRRDGSLSIALLVGIGILILIRLVPVLGGLVTLVALLLGLGALVLALQARTASPFFHRREKAVEAT